MADEQAGIGPPPDALRRDAPTDAWASWTTIWQSELAALATDREALEYVLRSVSQWGDVRAGSRADAARTHIDLCAAIYDEPPVSGPDAPAGPTPPMAAPDAREDAISRLAERVAALERRLDGAGDTT